MPFWPIGEAPLSLQLYGNNGRDGDDGRGDGGSDSGCGRHGVIVERGRGG